MWIYCITNKTTGKKYVGKTKRRVSSRWSAHCHDALKRGLNTHFARAVRKYGKEDFVVEILEKCNSIPDLNSRETWWIETVDSYRNGYNSTRGGDGGSGIKWSEEARKKQSEIRLGMKFSEEHKANLSRAHQGKSSWNKGLCGELNPLFGKQRPIEVKTRISESKWKKVQQLSLDGKPLAVFESIRHAASTLGIGNANITKCCKGQRVKTGGFRWCYV